MKKVSGYIERKSMLYKTKVEYGDYTMNHVMGCAHGCRYPCYAFLIAKRFRKVESYDDWVAPHLVSNTLEILDKEIPRLKSKIKSVQLCFTTDPFMYQYDEIAQMSITAIAKLNEAGIKCTVLTKGLLPEVLASLSDDNEYGITLISLNEDYRMSTEPGAAPYEQRLSALRRLHDLGCKTWVSIEPYPTPNLLDQDLKPILEAISFTDKIIFGRTNYNKEVSSFTEHKTFYSKKTQEVIHFCNAHGIQYHIKNGTTGTAASIKRQ
jgi:DNA repair photolyase